MRPERGDILDNFTPEKAAEVAALIASMPGCKLTVRRSRRRPEPDVVVSEDGMVSLAAVLDVVNFDEAQRLYGPHTVLGRLPRLREHYDDFAVLGEALHWTSPAQRGRREGRQKRLPKMAGLFSTLEGYAWAEAERARSHHADNKLLVSARTYEILSRVTRIDAEKREITIESSDLLSLNPLNEPMALGTRPGAHDPRSRKPAFIPTARLDGRR